MKVFSYRYYSPLFSLLLVLFYALTPIFAATSMAAVAETPLSASTYAVYTVRAGDTLSAIAARFGASIATLKSINGIANANQISVGLRLLVPSGADETGPTTAYTVRRGDTLNSIARQYRATVGVVQWLNGISNPNRIRVGQLLTVPALAGDSGGGGATGDPTPTRITFPAGGIAATVTGNVTFPNRACYSLGALAGQTMTVQITSPGNVANFLIKSADPSVNSGVPFKRLENEDRTFSFVLPATGDYIICVATPGGATSFSLAVSIPPVSTGCSTPNPIIRSLVWNDILSFEPGFTHEIVGGDHYVRVNGSSPEVYGIPQINQIVYGDFDGDCSEEAAIPLFSGGTAGNVGYVVYRYGLPRPHVIAWGVGYKLGLAVASHRLVVTNALYNGWEPNCCPSGFSYDTYKLAGDTLLLVSSTSSGTPEMQVETVRHFYELLQVRDFGNAYALLSTTFQGANPFAAWQAGYNNTVNFTFTVNPGVAGSNWVLVEIDATERTASGRTRIMHYSGYWDITWDGARPGWVLQSASFAIG